MSQVYNDYTAESIRAAMLMLCNEFIDSSSTSTKMP